MERGARLKSWRGAKEPEGERTCRRQGRQGRRGSGRLWRKKLRGVFEKWREGGWVLRTRHFRVYTGQLYTSQSTVDTWHTRLYTLHSRPAPYFRCYTLHPSLLTAHLTRHTPHFTLHTLHLTRYTWHSRRYTPHSTLATVHPSLTFCPLHFTLYIVHFTHFTPHTPHTVNFTHCTLHSTLYTPHSALDTVHTRLYTRHSLLYTPYRTLYTLHFIFLSYRRASAPICNLHPAGSFPLLLSSYLKEYHSKWPPQATPFLPSNRTICTATLHTAHSTLYTLHFTLYTLPSTHHTLYVTRYTPHSLLHTLHSTLHTLYSTLYTSHSTLYTLHSTLYALHTTLYTLHLHSTLYTLNFALDTLHSTPYTLHPAGSFVSQQLPKRASLHIACPRPKEPAQATLLSLQPSPHRTPRPSHHVSIHHFQALHISTTWGNCKQNYLLYLSITPRATLAAGTPTAVHEAKSRFPGITEKQNCKNFSKTVHMATYTRLYTLHFTHSTLHFTLFSLHTILYTLHVTLLTPYCTLYTPHSILYTPHSTLHTLHFTLYTLHSTLYTLHFTLYTYTPHSTL